MGAVIIGCGKSTPNLEIENDDLKALVDTNDEWIRTRTGIGSRHISVDETTGALAYAASAAALGMNASKHSDITSISYCAEPIDPESIDLVIFPTITPDSIVPSAAAALKKDMGLQNAIAFDINAACTGFIYGISVAESMMAASNLAAAQNRCKRPKIKRALIVCSERLSRLTDWNERGTCVLFGDGAGAAVLEWRDDEPGIIATYMRNDDDDTNALTCPNNFTAPQPFTKDGIDASASDVDEAADEVDAFFDLVDVIGSSSDRQVIRMDGQAVFKFAGKAMASCVEHVVEQAGLALDDIKLIVPHQANERIIRFAAKRLSMDIEAFQLSIEDTGNTSSSGVPMALTDALAQGKLERGDKVVLVAFGGGLTSGAVLLEI